MDYMKRIILSTLALLFCLSGVMAEGAVCKKTYTYTHRGEQALYLDIYSTSDSVQPCLLYIFGGAFLTGQRAEPEVVQVYEYFAQNGWKVVSIDYRLGLLPLIEEPDVKRSLLDFRKMLIGAIDVAVEDLLEATAYLVTNAEMLGIDPSKIVTLGASAGAITACQAEWAICNSSPAAAVLPEDFNFAGVISMAGAICASGRDLEWKKEPCPMMLFHGNADKNVPYGTQSLLNVRLFGSESIASSLEELGSPYWFYDADNMDHNFSWRPMYYHREEMWTFMNRMVLGGERLLVHQRVSDKKLPKVKHNFGLKDYIKNNFDPDRPHGVEAATY